MSPEQMVQNGIALLDRDGPAKWWDRINVARLDISSAYSCVLGQLYGDYERGVWTLRKTLTSDCREIAYGYLGDGCACCACSACWAERHGFTRSYTTPIWQHAIRSRQAAAALVAVDEPELVEA